MRPIAVTGRDGPRLAATRAALSGAGHFSYCADLAIVLKLLPSYMLHGEPWAPGWHRALRRQPASNGRSQSRPPRGPSNAVFERPQSAALLVGEFRSSEHIHPVQASSCFRLFALTRVPPAIAYIQPQRRLIGMMKSLAAELARDTIRVNCVLPGVVNIGKYLHDLRAGGRIKVFPSVRRRK